MKFCAASGGGDKLAEQFAAMSVSQTNPAPAPKVSQSPSPPGARPSLASPKTVPLTPSTVRPTKRDASQTLDSPPVSSPNPTAELGTILSAMRKLREAIVASHRTDHFAQRAYIFIIHAAILTKSWESYLPALRYLLNHIHAHTPMTSSEFNEFAGYYVLDLACRQGDLASAFAHRSRLGLAYSDPTGRVDRLLRALVMDDWISFWQLHKLVDGYQKRILEFKEDDIRLHALKCLGRSYFGAEKGYIEKCTGRDWDQLVKSGVGWELHEGDKVVIRRPKAR
ncbi:putative sac3 ganp nin1 mts3 eif-3 p25 protein [Lasiodiplodia theobromae]|uniref:Protein transport protein sec31 n=1 Tax=Lasiodiplodia hormozganensis TaxID=869390 RepID=A0AA39Z1I8_9PEZI|nr:SAC3/GANP/Nin1/mts3/eIF-3 p25 protein [Lasiodiplodia theobromae]KAF4543755.1 SAC3/GANP/Nin1/mts3/eIF-3 p25 protein [Lasiodiplodia theobromae]KAF9631494.1 putative sac3 ganp nin1 mts3 eif-3 p25 protein [Lasiodiplodia theobromae]KAK0662186.1 Protein transport protein sec31 [Lasiodiplodia hormozganensis]